MYTGDWARAYVAAVRAEGGKVTLEDLMRYLPEWRDPLSVEFAGATVFGPGEDPSGDCPTLEALNLLSALRIDTLGPYWRDPKAFVAYARALRFATYAGDSLPKTKAFRRDHGLAPGCDTRLSPQFADAIAPNLATLMGQAEVVAAPDQHTEAVVAVDRWGNVAALVHTINTVDWGDTGIVVGGIPVSDAGGIYRDEPAVMKPGARLPELAFSGYRAPRRQACSRGRNRRSILGSRNDPSRRREAGKRSGSADADERTAAAPECQTL
jgi:gamma-glutamyltranspeptidase/glutathione hydrolase